MAAETVDPDGNPWAFALYDTGQAVAGVVAQAGHEQAPRTRRPIGDLLLGRPVTA